MKYGIYKNYLYSETFLNRTQNTLESCASRTSN